MVKWKIAMKSYDEELLIEGMDQTDIELLLKTDNLRKVILKMYDCI